MIPHPSQNLATAHVSILQNSQNALQYNSKINAWIKIFLNKFQIKYFFCDFKHLIVALKLFLFD